MFCEIQQQTKKKVPPFWAPALLQFPTPAPRVLCFRINVVTYISYGRSSLSPPIISRTLSTRILRPYLLPFLAGKYSHLARRLHPPFLALAEAPSKALLPFRSKGVRIRPIILRNRFNAGVEKLVNFFSCPRQLPFLSTGTRWLFSLFQDGLTTKVSPRYYKSFLFHFLCTFWGRDLREELSRGKMGYSWPERREGTRKKVNHFLLRGYRMHWLISRVNYSRREGTWKKLNFLACCSQGFLQKMVDCALDG